MRLAIGGKQQLCAQIVCGTRKRGNAVSWTFPKQNTSQKATKMGHATHLTAANEEAPPSPPFDPVSTLLSCYLKSRTPPRAFSLTLSGSTGLSAGVVTRGKETTIRDLG